MLQRTTRKTLQRAETTRSRGIFPITCMICKEKDLKVKGVRQPLSKIVTTTAERTIKEAAIAQNDLQMIVARSETDLIAKEFQKHEKCYIDYSRVVRKRAESAENIYDDQTGDYNAVLSLLEHDIMGGSNAYRWKH